MIRYVSILLLAITLLSCDQSDPPPQLEGEYEMTTQNQGVTASFRIDLDQSGASVSGSGDLTLEDSDSPQAATTDLTVEGEHEHPDVSLEMTTSESEKILMDGEASAEAERVAGTVTFPSGVQKDVVLRR